jgi:carbon-monoxide dehydrogenase medium subunit
MSRYLQPETLEEAYALLDNEPDLKLLAGGTDLLVLIKQGVIAPGALADIKKIPETRVLDVQNDVLRIGAAITLNEIIESPVIPESMHILKQAAQNLANGLLRNRATLVGNLCNASPGADMAGACMVLNATVIAASSEGERRIAIEDFFTGVKKHSLNPGEIVTRVEFPVVRGRGVYLKKRRIRGHDLAQVGVSGFYSAEHEFRLALGAVAITPLLIDFGKLEPTDLKARRPEIIDKAAETARPITDIRASKEFRAAMVRHFTGRIVDAFAAGKEA